MAEIQTNTEADFGDEEIFLSASEAAIWFEQRGIDVKEPKLRAWRSAETGPPFYRFGGQIYYAEIDLKRFIQSSRYEPDSQPHDNVPRLYPVT